MWLLNSWYIVFVCSSLLNDGPVKCLRPKRRLLDGDDDECSQIPRKRSRSRSNGSFSLKTFLMDSPEKKITPKSFYGISGIKYLSPLDRKHLKEIRTQKESVMLSAVVSPKSSSALKPQSKSASKRSKVVSRRFPANNCSPWRKELVKPFVVKHFMTNVSGETDERTDELSESKGKVKKAEVCHADKPRKFFKNQRGNVSEDGHACPQVELRKGLKLSCYQTVSGSDLKRTSRQVEGNVKTSVTSLKRSQLNSNILDSLTKIKRYSFSEGRMTNCDVVELNSASKPKQDVKNGKGSSQDQDGK